MRIDNQIAKHNKHKPLWLRESRIGRLFVKSRNGIVFGLNKFNQQNMASCEDHSNCGVCSPCKQVPACLEYAGLTEFSQLWSEHQQMHRRCVSTRDYYKQFVQLRNPATQAVQDMQAMQTNCFDDDSDMEQVDV